MYVIYHRSWRLDAPTTGTLAPGVGWRTRELHDAVIFGYIFAPSEYLVNSCALSHCASPSFPAQLTIATHTNKQSSNTEAHTHISYHRMSSGAQHSRRALHIINISVDDSGNDNVGVVYADMLMHTNFA